MTNTGDEKTLELNIPDNFIQNIFGNFDANIRKLERTFNIDYVQRGEVLQLNGTQSGVEAAAYVINEMLKLLRNGGTVNEQKLDYIISLVKEKNTSDSITDLDSSIICHTIQGRPVKAKTFGQKKYVEAIDKNMIIFGTGPAGTGKTYLAMAKAISAFKRNEVERIILTRPAIEAGEKLGFLPGDLQSKIDPYLRPLYDALYEIMGAEQFMKNMEKGLVEVAPLAYMRGRTLDNAFIVLDEAQNTTPSQMKMFLTRIGFGSKAIITGDLTQKDLAGNTKSGLEVALKVIKNIEGIEFCEFTSKDVVRHPLVQKIVEAYDAYDKKIMNSSHKPKH
ncbi:MAG: PhoH family protein [Eubacterium sp.]|nr:PhoH family protein [Eubacterium sp.]